MLSGRRDLGAVHASSHSGLRDEVRQGLVWQSFSTSLLWTGSQQWTAHGKLFHYVFPSWLVIWCPLNVMVLEVGPQNQTEPSPCSGRSQSPGITRFSKSWLYFPYQSPCLWCCLGLLTLWTSARLIFPTPKGTKEDLALMAKREFWQQLAGVQRRRCWWNMEGILEKVVDVRSPVGL